MARELWAVVDDKRAIYPASIRTTHSAAVKAFAKVSSNSHEPWDGRSWWRRAKKREGFKCIPLSITPRRIKR